MTRRLGTAPGRQNTSSAWATPYSEQPANHHRLGKSVLRDEAAKTTYRQMVPEPGQEGTSSFIDQWFRFNHPITVSFDHGLLRDADRKLPKGTTLVVAYSRRRRRKKNKHLRNPTHAVLVYYSVTIAIPLLAMGWGRAINKMWSEDSKNFQPISSTNGKRCAAGPEILPQSV